ncbi:hypothetical protein PR202_ga23765 [Eleusine coracana subsp. coracana]|uniref:Uncharacterized protein n=1 Tax=Eleusine coracana subsp. coracana TaxID=191504 RepID=A0AAV5D6M5_ELECO|nr:hypothetical protein PR202_ga23765 [Eleusine coracana subsp. coracana]
MDLDVMDSGEADAVTGSASGSMGGFSRLLEWKLELVSTISTFFSVLSHRTWEIMYSLMEKESDLKVRQAILLCLCKNIPASSETVSSVVDLIIDMRDRGASSLLKSAECLTQSHALLKSLRAICDGGQNTDGHSKNQDILLGLVHKATEISFTDWVFRIKLIDCICLFIYLFPDVAQDFIGSLLDMLHDPDYRVRFYLTREIVVLFQTWEGHTQLFDDVCKFKHCLTVFYFISSNVGVKLVKYSNSSPVKAREVLAVGSQPVLGIETALVTLAHLAVHSEDAEVECVFMISAAAALEPSQRELAYALFDSMSRTLGYASRSKMQEMFGYRSAEPKNFVEHCCSWLLSFLILRGNIADLNWTSKILSQPLSVIIKRHFVPIFGLSIAAKCGKSPEKDSAETVLCESLLHLAEISEFERDDLIKKHMVSIVAFLLSVSSSAHEPEIPYFSKEVIALSVKTVVDGFLDTMDDDLADTVVIDKLNVFRADRVFKVLYFIGPIMLACLFHLSFAINIVAIVKGLTVQWQRPLAGVLPPRVPPLGATPAPQGSPLGLLCVCYSMHILNLLQFLLATHQQVADASHPRHMGHRICAIEVLMDVLGHRVILESTCLHLPRPSIEFEPGQQPAKLSTLLPFPYLPFSPCVTPKGHRTFTTQVLGRQLQVVIPKLVTCCLNNEKEERSGIADSSRVFSLLHQLTVDADPLLYDYIRDLEPLPDLDCLKDIQEFHISLSSSYSSRDRFLKFVSRAPYLPPELFLLSSSCVANEASSVLADFISRVGISDVHQVVLDLPTTTLKQPLQLHCVSTSKEDKLCSDYGISDDILVGLLKLLKSYLSDESVEIIDITSQTLRGILSTARGLNALQCFDSLDRSLLMIHSRGVNIQIVEQTISGMEKYSDGE